MISIRIGGRRARLGDCPDCGATVALTKEGRAYPRHRGSRACARIKRDLEEGQRICAELDAEEKARREGGAR